MYPFTFGNIENTHVENTSEIIAGTRHKSDTNDNCGYSIELLYHPKGNHGPNITVVG